MSDTQRLSAQQPAETPAEPAASGAAPAAQDVQNGSAKSVCPPHVLAAIYGRQRPEEKAAALDASLNNWWTSYSDRKNDEEHEYVADSLLYDRRQLPRTAPPPTRQVPQPPQQQQAPPQQAPTSQ